MNKIFLVILSSVALSFSVHAQNSLNLDASYSGYVTPGDTVFENDLKSIKLNGNRGFITFDLNTVPNGATITGATLTLSTGGTSFSTGNMPSNLDGLLTLMPQHTANAKVYYNDPASGATLGTILWDGATAGAKAITLNEDGITALQNKCGAFISFGVTAPVNNNTYTYTFGGYNDPSIVSNTPPPSLNITYTAAAAQAPKSDFYANKTAALENEELFFYENCGNSPTSWEWDFGDGTTETGPNPVKAYATAGKYTVKLKASNAQGNQTETKTEYITVYRPVIADFKADATYVLLDTEIQFSDSSKNNPVSWKWNFGDGGTSDEQHPLYVYSGTGTYTVTLIAKGAIGSDTMVKANYIQVTDQLLAPEASFSYSTAELQVNFWDESSYNPESWLWDFDATANPGVNTSTEQHPQFTYSSPGTYQVCLTATNSGGSHTTCENVTVTQAGSAPQALFSYTADKLEVSFKDSSLNDPTSWAWDFDAAGNPGVHTSADKDPVFTYPAGGTYNVCLTVTNSFGAHNTCKNVTVNPGGSAPQTDFSFTKNDLEVTFDDQTLNTPTSWAWDFDFDSNPGVYTSTAQNPVYTYQSAGTYKTCLTASNAFGSNTTCKDVVVSQAGNSPVADFSFQITNKTVTFTDLSANFPTSWNWDFGNMQTSTLQHPSHTYTTAGNYTVCLTAANLIGSDDACKAITIVVTGIEGETAEFIIYPNPVKDRVLHIASDVEINGIKLINTAGQEWKIPVSSTQGHIQAHLSEVPPGFYILRLLTGQNKFIYQKLIIE